MKERLSVSFRIEPDGAWQKAKGHDACALLALHEDGKRGVTPTDAPGPRWSGCVFKLRRLGLDIKTVHEHHVGPFAGTHARYVLHSQISILEGEARGKAA